VALKMRFFADAHLLLKSSDKPPHSKELSLFAAVDLETLWTPS